MESMLLCLHPLSVNRQRLGQAPAMTVVLGCVRESEILWRAAGTAGHATWWGMECILSGRSQTPAAAARIVLCQPRCYSAVQKPGQYHIINLQATLL